MKITMDYGKSIRNLSHNSKSVFVSYARNEDKRFINQLLKWLQKSGYEVVSCDCPENAWAGMMQAGMTCRNVVLVSTDKYAYTCLMGQVKSNKLYAQYPSLAFISLSVALDQSLPTVEAAMKIAFTIYGVIGQQWMTIDRLKFLCEALTGEKTEAGPVRYYFSDDYCLEESQTIIRSEKHFARIVTLFRSGEDCICRYPIIDSSQDRDIDSSFSELSLYLKSEPSERLKRLERPQILRVVSGSGKGTKGGISLEDVTFWRLSDRHLFAMIPSCYQGAFKGTMNTMLRDWEALRR